MTLNSLNSLSSSQLVDRGPKFITTFHFPLPAYLIYDSINNNHCCRMPCHPQCPSCPLPACADYHQLFSPLKLYLLISLCGPVTLFLRVMPRGEAKSDLAIPLRAASCHSRVICLLFRCQKLAQSNRFFFCVFFFFFSEQFRKCECDDWAWRGVLQSGGRDVCSNEIVFCTYRHEKPSVAAILNASRVVRLDGKRGRN